MSEATRYEVRNPNTAPPGGWRYQQPETMRVWFGEPSLDKLAQDVTAHRMLNSIEPGNPRADIMHQTGHYLVQAGFGHYVKIHQPVERRLADYWKGLKGAYWIERFESQGRPVLVAPETAEYRAGICADCPMNVADSADSVLKAATNAAMAKLVGGRTTSKDEQLETCKVCTCKTQTLVHLTGELLKESGHLNHLRQYPTNCWKHTAFKP